MVRLIIIKYFTFSVGTFQKVDFVFLIGIGGGVPHYTDYNKHVRLGDVVISYPIPLNKKYIYVYCESAKTNESGDYHFETKEYCPPNLCLQEIAVNLKDQVGCYILTPNADERLLPARYGWIICLFLFS